MDMKLRVAYGKHIGQEIRVPGRSFVIGRGDECQLRAGSDMISRRHCELTVEDSRTSVVDLGSKNGTYVNDVLIAGNVELKSGDKLRLGPLQFEVILTAGLTGKKLPPVQGVKDVARAPPHPARTAKKILPSG